MKLNSRYILTEFGGFHWRGQSDPTEKQLGLVRFLSRWRFGTHHFGGTVSDCGGGVSLVARLSPSTYDFDELTWLVLLSHKHFVRVEVSSRGLGYLEVMCHQRKPKEEEGESWAEHPSLSDLIARAEKINREANQ